MERIKILGKGLAPFAKLPKKVAATPAESQSL
jgi:hypothetical protein